MFRNFIIGACLALSAACIPNAAGRAETAATAAVHQVALEKCIGDAMNSIKAGSDQKKTGDDYAKCADAADKASGKK